MSIDTILSFRPRICGPRKGDEPELRYFIERFYFDGCRTDAERAKAREGIRLYIEALKKEFDK